MISKLWEKLRGLDLRNVLILLFITVSTGHVGRLFADREAVGQWILGYVFALALDVALALSLYEVGYATERGHKLWALAGFIMACGISGGFNVYYYRLFFPDDPELLSLLLGLAAPILAAFFGLLKGRRDVQRREEKGQLELEKFKLELEADTQKTLLLEKERTKQMKLQMETEAKARQAAETKAQRLERQRKELANLGKSAEILQAIREMPEITREELGEKFDIGQRTVNYHLAKLEKTGAINRNGDQMRLLWELAELEKEKDETNTS